MKDSTDVDRWDADVDGFGDEDIFVGSIDAESCGSWLTHWVGVMDDDGSEKTQEWVMMFVPRGAFATHLTSRVMRSLPKRNVMKIESFHL